MSDMTKKISGSEYKVTHSVGANQAGIRLDRFLMDRYTRRSREKIKRVIDSGAVTVLRESARHLSVGKIKASFSLQPGDIVQVISIRKPEPEVNFAYKILYEDPEILVIDKPPNLPVHPAGRFFFHTLLIHLKTEGFKVDLKSERNFFLVHRIDKETSGVLLLAKTKEACNALTAQFRNRETQKYYLALVKGAPAESPFQITSPIGKPPKGRVGIRMVPLPVESGGLESETLFETVETRTNAAGTFSLLACFPRTGRQHQIRVHAEIAGHPLVGDKVYGLSDDEVLAWLDGAREHERSMVSPEPAEDLSIVRDEVNHSEGESDFDPGTDADAPILAEDEDEQPFEIQGPTSSIYAEMESRLLLPRHALHAAGLRFRHPRTNEVMAFESDLPEDLRSFFESLTGAPLRPFRTRHW
jgi:23S rRNA pseudouridine1911/1915/1917 synthase